MRIRKNQPLAVSGWFCEPRTAACVFAFLPFLCYSIFAKEYCMNASVIIHFSLFLVCEVRRMKFDVRAFKFNPIYIKHQTFNFKLIIAVLLVMTTNIM